jgi:hypothetical protein
LNKKGEKCKTGKCRVHPKFVNKILKKNSNQEKDEEMIKVKIWNMPICGNCREQIEKLSRKEQRPIWKY